MRILITGGAGFIGSHLCDFFLGGGHEVVCMDNLLTGREENVAHHRDNRRFEFVHHDVTEFIEVDGELDFILHFASPASPDDFERLGIRILKVGALGTHKTLGLARAKGAKFLLASTSEVYGDPLVHPQSEGYWGNVNPIGIRGVYDEAKRFAESMTMAYNRLHGIDTRIVRIFNTYGERMRRNDGRAVPNFITQCLAGTEVTVYGDGSQTRSIGHVSDLVAGIDKLMASDVTTPVNLGNPAELSMKELAEKIIRFTDSSSAISYHPLPADDPKIRLPDISKAQALLGWEPKVTPDEGLQQAIAWFREDAPGGEGGGAIKRESPRSTPRERGGRGLEVRECALGFELHDGERLVALYRAREELPRTESPKPCFAPVYSPSGGLITEYRPADHQWHTGLYFGWVHVDNANLWGGPWYLPELEKYEYVDHSHGVQRHDEFVELSADAATATARERLTWLGAEDEPLARECRTYTFGRRGEAGYAWRVETRIEPVGERLTLGASRAAKYSGFELRMGPPFADARHHSSEGTEGHEHIMGRRARWVSAAGAAGGMVVMMDHPNNPRHPVTWFTRKNLLGAGLLMEEDLDIESGGGLTLVYGLDIYDEARSPEDIEIAYRQFAGS